MGAGNVSARELRSGQKSVPTVCIRLEWPDSPGGVAEALAGRDTIVPSETSHGADALKSLDHPLGFMVRLNDSRMFSQRILQLMFL